MIPPRILAYALMAGGILGIVMTGVTVWGGIARWFAVDNLRAAYVDAIAGESEAARAAGRRAYAWLPNSPATLLAAADPAAPGTPEQLLAAARGQRPADRAALAAGIGAILGHPPEGLDPDPSDLPFLVAIAAKAPGPVAGEPGQAPHATVLAAWGASRLTAAWIAHRRSDVYAAASTLLILAPQHPQAAELTLITLALGPNPSTKAELTTSAGRIADVSRLHWLGGMLLALAPERTELRQLIGEADTVSSGDAQLAALVATAKAAPQGIEDGVIIACLQAGRQDLADELIALAPAARTARLSQTQGLLLGAFAADDPAQVSPLVATSDQLAFHLSNRAGALPSGTLVVVIGEAEVPADQVSRQGTLITVPLTVRGHQDIRITYAGTVVFAANIAL